MALHAIWSLNKNGGPRPIELQSLAALTVSAGESSVAEIAETSPCPSIESPSTVRHK